MIVAIEPARQPDVEALLRLSDVFTLGLYPAENCYLLDVGELDAPGVSVFVARGVRAGDAASALGMVALVDRGDATAELKRMFVCDDTRGRGVAGALLGAVEAHARTAGIHLVQLETGPLSRSAIALYEKHGYAHIPTFGPYVGDPFSVCMEKLLPVTE